MKQQLICAILFLSLACSAAAQTETSTAPISWERYKISDMRISTVLPKMPTVVGFQDFCSEVDKRAYYAYADNAVYEFVVTAKSKTKIPAYCDVKKNFNESVFTDRLSAVRSDQNTNAETSLFENGRQVYKFVNKFVTRWIISDLKNNRWAELAIHRRENLKADDENFLRSLEFLSSEGKEIGEGSKTTLGDVKIENETATPEQNKIAVTESMRIIGKPRAKYTDSARRANVQGSVLLKVTLLSNGSVGSVTPVKELPNGLTEQAIAAARKIVFLPKRVNGVSINVIVTFDYGFSIY
jgi:TonB family protein